VEVTEVVQCSDVQMAVENVGNTLKVRHGTTRSLPAPAQLQYLIPVPPTGHRHLTQKLPSSCIHANSDYSPDILPQAQPQFSTLTDTRLYLCPYCGDQDEGGRRGEVEGSG
jgi:hypothetical protein